MFEENNWQEDDELSESIARFEGMIENNDSYFFDMDILEELFDYYFDINNKANALKVVKHAMKIYPDSPQLRLKYAQALAASYKPQLALEILQSLEPNIFNSVDYFLIKADIFNQLRKYGKATECLLEAQKMPLDDLEKEDIFMNLAFTYKENNEIDKAQECFKNVINLNPENEIALFEMSFLYQEKNKIAEFITWINTFIDQYPYSHYAWFVLGKSYEFSLEFQKALEAFDYATVIKENYAAAHIAKGDILVEMDETEKAVNSYKTALKHQEADSDIYFAIGDCYLNLGEPVNALTNFKKANKIDPLNVEVWLGMSEAYEELKDFQTALFYIKKCVAFNKEDIYFLSRYASISMELGFFEETKNALNDILKIEPDNKLAMLSLSNLLYQQAKILQAIALIEEFLMANPAATEVRYRYVAYLIILNKIDDANDNLYIALLEDKKAVSELLNYLPLRYITTSLINTIKDFDKDNGL